MPKTPEGVSYEQPPGAAFADPTRLLPIGRTRNERFMIDTLERRLTYLGNLRPQPHTTSVDSKLRFQAYEVLALRWALQRIADAEHHEKKRSLGDDDATT